MPIISQNDSALRCERLDHLNALAQGLDLGARLRLLRAAVDGPAVGPVTLSALEARGYRSVGCEPCTRAARDDHPERAGRRWWEQDGSAHECGLHRSPHLAGAA